MKPPTTFYRYAGKRFFDLLLTVPALILFSPVLAALSLLVRVRLGTPIFFRQLRPGLRPALTGCAQTRAERNARSRESRRRLDHTSWWHGVVAFPYR